MEPTIDRETLKSTYERRQILDANTAPKYGYYYDEGAGYLFVSYLDHGADGCACLVRSIRDDQLYVRKSYAKERLSKAKVRNLCQKIGEIATENISSFIKHNRSETRPKGVDASYREYANGGSLAEFLEGYAQAETPGPIAMV
jgi:hypothetical protein